MRDKLIRQALAVIIGGVLAVYCGQGVRMWILAFFVLLLGGLYLWWKPHDFLGRLVKPEVIMLFCSIIIGFFYGMSAEKLSEPLVIKEVQLEGRLSDWILDDSGGRGIIILDRDQLETEYPLGKKYSFRVYPDSQGVLKDEWKLVQAGDKIRVTGKLEHPQAPGTEGEFDLPLYNAVRGLSGTITTSGEAVILERGVTSGAAILPAKIRQKVHTALSGYWPSESGTLEGILFGDSSAIPAETLEMYKAAGVMHVFAASGANVVFVMALAWAGFFFLPRNLRILASLGAILLYAALCQGNPPILRATILGAAVLGGKLGQGKMASLRWLVLAALILFIYNPWHLKDTSFQLSFAAAWGMIVLSPRLEKLRGIKRMPQSLKLAATVALAAQIATLPILTDIFHRVSLAGFLTNIFMLFLLGAVLQLGLIGCILICFPGIHLVFFQVAFWLLKMADTVLKLVASFPLSYFWILNPGILFWVFWYAALAVLLVGKQKVWFIVQVQLRKVDKINKLLAIIPVKRVVKTIKNKKYLCIVLSIILVIVLLCSPWKEERRLTVTFLDVGQGDCILIQTPQEKLLVDTGPKTERFDAGERILVPYLMEKRIGNLDMVFITHEDSDHLGGAKYLLNNIPVAKVAIPEFESGADPDDWLEGIPAGIMNDERKLLMLKAGDYFEFKSGLRIDVLAPVFITDDREAEANSHSLVLLLEYLGRKVLLTGDMEKEEMQQIEQRGLYWDADVIEIPHHGSKGSLNPLWFEQINPLAVVISVGPNSFGHPAPEVLEYWQDRNVPVFRTDIQGTIRLEIDNQGLRIIPGRN